MKWAMSDDYAALITTVIMAELLIGSVQAYTLMKAWAEPTRQLTLRIRRAAENIVTARKAGEDVDPDDVALLRSPGATVQGMLRSTLPALTAGLVWVLVCGVLVGVQIKVLQWSGTHTPAKDPKLARGAFYISSGAVILLVGEGVLRVLARAYSGMIGDALRLARFKGEDRDHLNAALADPEPADPAAEPETSAA